MERNTNHNSLAIYPGNTALIVYMIMCCLLFVIDERSSYQQLQSKEFYTFYHILIKFSAERIHQINAIRATTTKTHMKHRKNPHRKRKNQTKQKTLAFSSKCHNICTMVHALKLIIEIHQIFLWSSLPLIKPLRAIKCIETFLQPI